MKKLLLASLLATTAFAFAEEAAKPETTDNKKAAEQVEETDDAPLFWGFGNYGLYSGYQLYGSLVNSEPTMQGYAEANFNIPGDVKYFGNLGYLGIGIWSNTDLTDKRRNSYGKAFNEWDYNVHWGKTFWFDDDEKWGLSYRTSIVWYYYPHRRHNHINGSTATTMDWNHYFELTNPWVTPYLNVVHEYHESDGNLLQFGLKKTVNATDALSITPCLEFVWRNSQYNWCFPTQFGSANDKHGSGLATMKVGVDANYQITKYMGVFAKVAYCSIIDSGLRDNIDGPVHGSDYGDYKDFAWGGVGLTFNF